MTNEKHPGFPNIVPRENWDKGHEQPPIGDVRGTPAYLGYPNDTEAATPPLLSDEAMRPPAPFDGGLMALSYWRQGAIHARMFYEAKIASGELIVAKPVDVLK